MDKYANLHLINNIDPRRISTVLSTGYGWKPDGGWKYIESEYKPGPDPRIIISSELYKDAGREWFVAPENPAVGTIIGMGDLRFRIDGFYGQFYPPEDKWVHDIVASPV